MALPVYGTNNQSVSTGQKRRIDIYSEALRPQYIKTIELNSNIVPLLNILEKLKAIKPVGDQSFFHFEYDDIAQRILGSGSQASTLTTLLFASDDIIKGVKVNQILMVPSTGEQMVVTGVNYGAYTLDVTRGHGGTTAATIADGATVQILPMSDSDGNTAPSGIAVEPKKKTNYVQINKKALEMSGRAQEADTYQGGRWEADWKRLMKAMAVEKEKMFFWNQLSATGTVTTGGLAYWISSNLTDQNNVALTENALELYLQQVFTYNQGRKLIHFCGDNAIAWISKFAKDRWYPNTESEVVGGIKVNKFVSQWGDLEIIRHGQFNAAFEPAWAKEMFSVCPEMIAKANFVNRDMLVKKMVQTPDLDGRKDYVLDDVGVWLGAERCFGRMKNIPNPLAA